MTDNQPPRGTNGATPLFGGFDDPQFPSCLLSLIAFGGGDD
ncbi:hypothetical protein [Nocardia camponoti]|nr:hypothetical protein [Nocardia camponoti]